MIQAVEIHVASQEPLIVPVAALFEHAGPAYCLRQTRADIACRNQFRAQLAWPVFEELIRQRGAHRAVLARARGEFAPVRMRMTPRYWQPRRGGRRDAGTVKGQSRMVDVAVLFVREGPRTELAYVYRHRTRALQLLMEQLQRRRRKFKVEGLPIPAIAFEHTPQRLPIYHAGRGRVVPGPDVVVDGPGATIEQLLAGGLPAAIGEEPVCP